MRLALAGLLHFRRRDRFRTWIFAYRVANFGSGSCIRSVLRRNHGPMIGRTSVGMALALLGGVGTAAHANVEVGGVAGAHVFSDTNALGVAKSTESHPADSEKNSALFGVRFGFYFNEMLGIE